MSVVQPLQDALDAGRQLDPAAVGSQVLLMSGISIVTIFAFNFLRPKNKMVYEPKVKYHESNKLPPEISDTLLGWLPPLVNTRERELLDKIGLDAVAFLRFLRLIRWLFFGTALLTCGGLVPINIMYNNRHPAKYHDILSITTIRDVQGDILYAHIAVTYLITILLVILVYFHWRSMVRLRNQWFRSPEYAESFYARTVSITNLPKRFQTDQGLREFLDRLKMPYPMTSLHIARRVGRLPELIEYHNQTVRDLEAVLVQYLKGGKIGRRRPKIRVGGYCGCGGVVKDAIDFYTAKLKRTEAAVEEYRARFSSRKPERYGFASLAAVQYAHIVAKKLHGEHPGGTTFNLAPNPKDIIWNNMSKSKGVIFRRTVLGFIWLGIICFLSLIPLFPVATLANLDAITAIGYLPFLQTWSNRSPITYAIVNGVLPPAVAGVFTFFLPRIMRQLSHYMGATTRARLDRAVIARYFAFLIISQLIIFTLLGVLCNAILEVVKLVGKHASAREIFQNFDKLPATINKTYINQSSYWLKWFPMRGFLVVFDLAQIINLLWISFKTHIFGRTPRDIREWTKPPPFEYAIYYSNLVQTSFYVQFSIVDFFLAIHGGCGSALRTPGTSGLSGRLYRLLAKLLDLQVSINVRVRYKGGNWWSIGQQFNFKSLELISTIPPLIIIIVFKIFVTLRFENEFRYYIPSEDEIRHAKVHSQRADNTNNRLEHRFGHPSLQAKLFTPMLHARMMPLLAQVYSGKIESEKIRQRGGTERDVQVVEGIRVTAVEQKDLEYDPDLYQRDRGESDWDTQSEPSSMLLSPNADTNAYRSNQEYFQNYSNSSGPSTPTHVRNHLQMFTDQRHLRASQRQSSSYFTAESPHYSTYSPNPASPTGFTDPTSPAEQHARVLSQYSYLDNMPAHLAEYLPLTSQQYSTSSSSYPGSPGTSSQPYPFYPPNHYQGPKTTKWVPRNANLDGYITSSRPPQEPLATSQEIRDRGSTFIANIYLASSASEARVRIAYLKDVVHQNKPASHEIAAWRCMVLKQGHTGLGGADDFELNVGSVDDGEQWAGAKVLKVMQTHAIIDAVVVVSRWYGGTMLGPARFSHIETCATEVCQEFKRAEELRECISTLTTLDAVLAGLRAEYSEALSNEKPAASQNSSAPKSYTNLDLDKGRRLIKARENAIKSVKLLLAKHRAANPRDGGLDNQK
ncbi:hypothetical protein H0H81_010929 [Sphagnurus paluster]|uniref:Uncharacterized protein n=1 Tax=Sphagnurus paluster TaxID=117069 RepID=A0A9P7GPU6_9AGAR|nr:hypothetical protein H0H81_010929 [Sphagnurus paluster]